MGMAPPAPIILLCFFILLETKLASASSRHPAASNQPPASVQKACSSASSSGSLYDFCVESLASDPHSPTANLRDLSVIAVALAVSNATSTSSYISSLAAAGNGNGKGKGNDNDNVKKKLLRSCAGKYASAGAALRDSLLSLAADNYDYAAVNVAAAAEYPRVCRALFSLHSPTTFPPEIGRREEELERLCIVAGEVISLLLLPS